MYIPDWRKDEIYNLASQLAIQYSDTYPIMMKSLATKMGIILRPYSKLTDNELNRLKELLGPNMKDGFWLKGNKNGIRVDNIFYNDSIYPIERQKFTIAHEIGHVVLDHTQKSDLAEKEANLFASYILAPPELIDLLKPEDYMDIAIKFQLSNSCASNAFHRYKKWLKRKQENNLNTKPEYEITMISTYQRCFEYGEIF